MTTTINPPIAASMPENRFVPGFEPAAAPYSADPVRVEYRPGKSEWDIAERVGHDPARIDRIHELADAYRDSWYLEDAIKADPDLFAVGHLGAMGAGVAAPGAAADRLAINPADMGGFAGQQDDFLTTYNERYRSHAPAGPDASYQAAPQTARIEDLPDSVAPTTGAGFGAAEYGQASTATEANEEEVSPASGEDARTPLSALARNNAPTEELPVVPERDAPTTVAEAKAWFAKLRAYNNPDSTVKVVSKSESADEADSGAAQPQDGQLAELGFTGETGGERKGLRRVARRVGALVVGAVFTGAVAWSGVQGILSMRQH